MQANRRINQAGSRLVRCGRCGQLTSARSDAQAIRCSACRTVLQLRVLAAWSAGRRNQPPPINGHNKVETPDRPLAAAASAFGRKRAVLCGVNYRGKPYSLKGSINDVKSIKSFLVQQMRFPQDSVLLLTEDERDPERIPTKKNIQRAMKWLLNGIRDGDSVVFHFSGHGIQRPDEDGDEIDGNDEALCPLDFYKEGMILDDEINAVMVYPLPAGAKLHAIIDACHSGTVLDLPFACKMNKEGNHVWEDHTTNAYKGTSGGLAFCFSACDDDRKSGEGSVFTGENTGALTYSFLKAAKAGGNLTYGALLNRMHIVLHEAKTTRGINDRDLSKANVALEPQLSSSTKFEVFSTKFVL